MKILAIETSCDETAAAVTVGRKTLSNVIFSQINIHKNYGGVYPMLAKREHEKKIDLIIDRAIKNANLTWKNIDAIAVTFGQGLVVSLEVGVRKAKELAKKYNKPLIPIDHTEGHIYSCFAQNQNGNPKRTLDFPFLALMVSGGYTGLILVKSHQKYEVIGKTLDDAAGEALDKAAKIIGLSYPGGPIIERLAESGNINFLSLPKAMINTSNFNFSYSGIKTAFRRAVEKMSEKQVLQNINHLSASFQNAIFEQILRKTKEAILKTKTETLVVGGGVMANKKLRGELRKLAKILNIKIYFPYSKKLYGDNAAMIGVAAYFKYKNDIYLEKDFDKLERVGRPELKMWVKC